MGTDNENIKQVNTTTLNFRKGPSTTYEIIGTISKGEEVTILPIIDGWSVINYNGTIGYVSTTYLSDKLSDNISRNTVKKYVNVEILNFRKGPSTSYEIIGTITKDTVVEMISESNRWSKIVYNNMTGYVYSIYLTEMITDINNDINTSHLAEKVIAYAKSLLGKVYVWGDEGPDTFDCSGFTWYVFKNVANIIIPRVSSAQGEYGTYIELNNLQPADLVFFDTVGTYDKKITHVGIYIGNNQFIHSSSSQEKVVVSQLNSSYYSKTFVNGRRILT